jgi:hypothetical protein
LEHLSGTFTVAGRDARGVDVQEAAFLEELMSGISQVVSDTSHGRNQLGAGTQVSVLTEILVGVAFGWKWVSGAIAMANHLTRVPFWVANLQLKQLTLSRALDELALELVAGTNFACSDVIEVWHGAVDYDLESRRAAAIS